MYKIKESEGYPGHWESNFCYQITQGKVVLVTINSNRLLFEEEFLDYYAEACDIEREGLSLRYTGSSLVVNHVTGKQ